MLKIKPIHLALQLPEFAFQFSATATAAAHHFETFPIWKFGLRLFRICIHCVGIYGELHWSMHRRMDCRTSTPFVLPYLFTSVFACGIGNSVTEIGRQRRRCRRRSGQHTISISISLSLSLSLFDSISMWTLYMHRHRDNGHRPPHHSYRPRVISKIENWIFVKNVRCVCARARSDHTDTRRPYGVECRQTK